MDDFQILGPLGQLSQQRSSPVVPWVYILSRTFFSILTFVVSETSNFEGESWVVEGVLKYCSELVSLQVRASLR